MHLIRITTVPISLYKLLEGQMKYMSLNALKVTMVSSGGKEIESLIKREECQHLEVSMTRNISPFYDFIALCKLYFLFRKCKPEIVHTHTPKAGLLGMVAAKLARVPVRIHTVAGLPYITSKGWTKKILAATERITTWGAVEVWPNSKSIFDFMLTRKLAPIHKLHMIGIGSSNGISLDFHDQQFKDQLVIPQIDISKHLPIMTYVGRLVRDKGIVDLVEAFCRSNPNAYLLLAGEYESVRLTETIPNHVKQSIRDHPRIIHLGWVSNISSLLNYSDILIHPSYREGFPNVLLQAILSKCLVVCSDIAGNVDAVDYGSYALLYEVGNRKDLALKMNIALREFSNSGEMLQRGKEWVETHFDRDLIHREILINYRRLISQLTLPNE